MYEQFENSNWLLIGEVHKKLVNSSIFKFINDQCLKYLNVVIQDARARHILYRILQFISQVYTFVYVFNPHQLPFFCLLKISVF